MPVPPCPFLFPSQFPCQFATSCCGNKPLVPKRSSPLREDLLAPESSGRKILDRSPPAKCCKRLRLSLKPSAPAEKIPAKKTPRAAALQFASQFGSDLKSSMPAPAMPLPAGDEHLKAWNTESAIRRKDRERRECSIPLHPRNMEAGAAAREEQ